MDKVYFATGNQGKLEEMKPLFDDKGLELAQVDVDVPEIDAMDVETVARRKVLDSREKAIEKGLIGENDMLIVEDTGFYVEAIGGFPGAEAAFFARTAGADKLMKLMKGEDDRSAYFKTAIAVYHDGEVDIFPDQMNGEVPREKRGDSHPHLPYNSYFVPSHADSSLAEDQGLKDNELHRTKAVKKFLEWLK